MAWGDHKWLEIAMNNFSPGNEKGFPTPGYLYRLGQRIGVIFTMFSYKNNWAQNLICNQTLKSMTILLGLLLQGYLILATQRAPKDSALKNEGEARSIFLFLLSQHELSSFPPSPLVQFTVLDTTDICSLSPTTLFPPFLTVPSDLHRYFNLPSFLQLHSISSTLIPYPYSHFLFS